LATAGIRVDQLSELVPTTYILRGMSPKYAAATGLHTDTPIVVGASDGVLANLGVGAITPDQIAITIGTSAAVRGVVPHPITDSQGRTFCYALTEKHWVVGGPSNNGGIVLRWFRDQFCEMEVEQAKREGLDPYDVMLRSAKNISAGAEGLLFLPYLSGERAPSWNPDARGVFFGMAMHHNRAHFIRAILEGILFNVYEITRILLTQIGDGKTIRFSGGLARSQICLQIVADLFGSEVLVPEVYEGSGFGAAVLAMYAVGALDDLADVQKLIRISDRYQPDLELSQRYDQLFEIYQQIYKNLIKEFSAIADYQRYANS
jgi:gluconokinase